MDATLDSLFNLYVLSTGRRVFALQQVKPIAEELGEDALVTLLGRALEHDARTLRLESSWAASGYDSDPQRVKRIDAQVDRTLSAIRDVAESQVAGGFPGEDLEETSQELMREIFPAGVFAVSSLPFVEELAAVEHILRQLRGPFSRHVETLGLGRLVARLGALAEEYRAAQEEKPKAHASWGDVRAARAKGQAYVLKVVALIVGRHFEDDAADMKVRVRLLEPILKQQEAVRQYLKVRRPVEDVDPATGVAQPVPGNSVPEVPARGGEVDG
jgi:hypothetical protein